ncbi:Scr1 family TA system antitoxin-like transcriptional regulator [Nocardia fluminea]|uniref:Scr1 family TA system antitoxin-like transcriptional regulator n=1 Tax=Nocardia fluminea TaxID=134984 RepID=UPI00340A4BC9
MSRSPGPPKPSELPETAPPNGSDLHVCQILRESDDSEALARLQRQTALDLPGYDFHMLLDEAALRVTVGSSEVMTTQIRHLMNILTAGEHVRIGIIALNAEFLAPADSFDFSYATPDAMRPRRGRDEELLGPPSSRIRPPLAGARRWPGSAILLNP